MFLHSIIDTLVYKSSHTQILFVWLSVGETKVQGPYKLGFERWDLNVSLRSSCYLLKMIEFLSVYHDLINTNAYIHGSGVRIKSRLALEHENGSSGFLCHSRLTSADSLGVGAPNVDLDRAPRESGAWPHITAGLALQKGPPGFGILLGSLNRMYLALFSTNLLEYRNTQRNRQHASLMLFPVINVEVFKKYRP